MASRLSGLFNSYDFFGKSIPGVVLLLGLVTFLPESMLTAAEVDISIRNIAVLTVAGLVLGLIFGEAVHNLAINIEQMFYWSRERTYDIFNLINIREIRRFFEITFGPTISVIKRTFVSILRGIFVGIPPIYKWRYNTSSSIRTVIFGFSIIALIVLLTPFYFAIQVIKSIASIGFISRAIDYLQRENEPTPIYILPYGLWMQGRKWFRRRRRGMYKGLISHRNLFERRFQLGISQYESSDGGKTPDIERFKDAYYETYNTDIRAIIDEIGEIYPVVATRLDALEYGRADNFQARYSFCRSMWVTLGFFLFAYVVLLLNLRRSQIEQILQSVPSRTVQLISQNNIWGRVVVGLLIGFIGGMILQYSIRRLSNYRLSENKPLAIIFSVLCYGSGVIATFEVEQTMVLAKDLIEKLVFALISAINWVLGFLWPLSDILVNVFLGQDYVSRTVFVQLLAGAHIQLIVLLVITVIVFFDASGDYKELYIDYLLIEFAEATDLENSDETLNLLHDIATGEEETGRT